MHSTRRPPVLTGASAADSLRYAATQLHDMVFTAGVPCTGLDVRPGFLTFTFDGCLVPQKLLGFPRQHETAANTPVGINYRYLHGTAAERILLDSAHPVDLSLRAEAVLATAALAEHLGPLALSSLAVEVHKPVIIYGRDTNNPQDPLVAAAIEQAVQHSDIADQSPAGTYHLGRTDFAATEPVLLSAVMRPFRTEQLLTIK